jgi:restriction endonuclease S subunit
MSTASISELGVTFFKGVSVKEKGAEGEYVLVPSGAVFPGHIKFERCKRFKGDAAKLSQKFLQPNDVLFNSGGVGTLGRSHHIEDIEPETYVPDSFVLVLRSSGEQLLSKYLYYYLQSPIAKQLIEENTRGTIGITSIKSEAVLGFPIPCPALPDQQRIVRLLDEAFEGIGTVKVNAEKNLQRAREIHHSVLKETIGALVRGIHPLHLRPIPVRVERLSGLMKEGTVQLFRGKVISKRDIARVPGTYPIYSSARDNEGKFGEYGEHMFHEELITWSVDGGGKLFHRHKHKYSVTNVGGILRILNQGVVNYEYLHLALSLRHSEARFDWVRKAHPSVIRDLYVDLPIPALDVQAEVAQRLSELRHQGDALAKVYSKKIDQCNALKASLLHQAFSGRLRVAP